MEEVVRKDFCCTCRKETEYVFIKSPVIQTIRDKEYTFFITEATCTECRNAMDVPGIIDKNIKEVDEQYRQYENIVSISDIERTMKLYNIGKTPLSVVLGFGEITITRYLMGQVPSKEYSDVIRKVMTSPAYMKECLDKNKEKIADAAYNKAMHAANRLEELFSISNIMIGTVGLLFEILNEVTPLMLQKLLYYVQGIHLSLHDSALFPEDCQAWIHGPVFPKVYDLFKDFKYNPIDDERFLIIKGYKDIISPDVKKCIQMVADTFGKYNGKLLEEITHKETPWAKSRSGYDEIQQSNVVITKDSIRNYFSEQNKSYNFSTEDGMNKYIEDMLSKN